MRAPRVRWTAAECAWVEANRHRPRRDAHADFVASFDRPEVSFDAFNSLCKRKGWTNGLDGRFKPGHTSPNAGKKGWRTPGSEKGWFKPGSRTGRANVNHQPVGTECLRDGYLVRKINEDRPFCRRWRAVHLLNWEALHGPVPEGHALKCLDGDRQNTDPANWALIPRSLQPRLSGKFGRGYDTAPAELKPIILATARLAQAAQDLKKGKRNG